MDQTVRDLSRVIFGGAQYRLEVCATLESGVEFTALDLVAQLGDPPGKASVHTEVKKLREAGLVVDVPRPSSARSRPMRAVDSLFWAACRELRDVVLERRARRTELKARLGEVLSQDELAEVLAGLDDR